MRPINIIMAVIGGAIAGATIGLLFAPEKGETTLSKIAELLKKKGIKLEKDKMDDLVESISNELK